MLSHLQLFQLQLNHLMFLSLIIIVEDPPPCSSLVGKGVECIRAAEDTGSLFMGLEIILVYWFIENTLVLKVTTLPLQGGAGRGSLGVGLYSFFKYSTGLSLATRLVWMKTTAAMMRMTARASAAKTYHRSGTL